MLVVNEAVKCRAIMNLWNVAHNAEDEMLDEEIAMFLNRKTTLNPFNTLP